MVTHDLASLNTVCDRVAALADGKIVAIGPMRDGTSQTQPERAQEFEVVTASGARSPNGPNQIARLHVEPVRPAPTHA